MQNRKAMTSEYFRWCFHHWKQRDRWQGYEFTNILCWGSGVREGGHKTVIISFTDYMSLQRPDSIFPPDFENEPPKLNANLLNQVLQLLCYHSSRRCTSLRNSSTLLSLDRKLSVQVRPQRICWRRVEEKRDFPHLMSMRWRHNHSTLEFSVATYDWSVLAGASQE